jgi:hypothetical protein
MTYAFGNQSEKDFVKMEEQFNNGAAKNKGGRPAKKIKRQQLLGVKCSLVERRIIEAKAKQVQLTVSEYLREMGLNGKIDSRQKALPKEILLLTTSIIHSNGLLNQIAKKINSLVPLAAFDMDALELLCRELKDAVITIKNYVQ